MATYNDYLTNLATQKSTMVSNINTVYQNATGSTGSMASDSETINSLVAKIPVLGAMGIAAYVNDNY